MYDWPHYHARLANESISNQNQTNDVISWVGLTCHEGPLVTFFYFDDFVIFKIFLLTLEFLKIWNFGKFFWGHSIPFRRWILHFIFSFSFSSAFCSLSEYYDVPNYDEYRFIGTFKLMCAAETREYTLSTGLYRLISYPTGTESRFPSPSHHFPAKK